MPRRICICTGCPNHHQHQATYDRDTAPGQRCPPCQAAATAQRNARPGSSSRGLGWDFTRRKAADPAWQAATHCQCPGCPWCGGHCGKPFTASNPKTGGHTTPRSQGGGSSPILAVCRSCNSSDGGRLAHRRKQRRHPQ